MGKHLLARVGLGASTGKQVCPGDPQRTLSISRDAEPAHERITQNPLCPHYGRSEPLCTTSFSTTFDFTSPPFVSRSSMTLCVVEQVMWIVVSGISNECDSPQAGQSKRISMVNDPCRVTKFSISYPARSSVGRSHIRRCARRAYTPRYGGFKPLYGRATATHATPSNPPTKRLLQVRLTQASGK